MLFCGVNFFSVMSRTVVCIISLVSRIISGHLFPLLLICFRSCQGLLILWQWLPFILSLTFVSVGLTVLSFCQAPILYRQRIRCRGSLFFHFFFYFHSVVDRDSKIYYSPISYFLLIATKSGRDKEICLYLKILVEFVSYSLGRVLACAYTIWKSGQISISCIILLHHPVGSNLVLLLS